MKDILRNVFPKNPTQTGYIRFLRKPQGPIRTAFSDKKDEWANRSKDVLKTAYTEQMDRFWRELNGK